MQLPAWCDSWWAQIDVNFNRSRTNASRSRTGTASTSSRQYSRGAPWTASSAFSQTARLGADSNDVLIPRARKNQKLTAAHEVSSRLAALNQENFEGVCCASSSAFHKTRVKPSHKLATPRELPPLSEVRVFTPVVAEALTSLTLVTDSGTERVLPHTWLVLDSNTSVEAAANRLSPQAGGGSITDGSERLQQVSDDRLTTTGAEANFQRSARASSLVGLRHAAFILTLFGNRERQSGNVEPIGPVLQYIPTTAADDRAKRVESMIKFRAAAASSRSRQAGESQSPRSARLPPLQNKNARQSMMQKGLQALEEFTRFAEHKFGNTLRAWFKLDPEGKMMLGEKQFARGCDEIGFHGNVVALWRYLDSDQSGHITILELDAGAAIALAEFKMVIRDRFQGSAQQAFAHMDANHSDRLFKDEFVKGMRSLGFKASSGAKLFNMFDRERLGSITSKDVLFLDRWSPPPYLFSRPDTTGLENLKNSLRTVYKSLLRAWRQLLDKDSSMRVSWDDFCSSCKHLEGRASIAQRAAASSAVPRTEEHRARVWRALDEDCGGWISLAEFDQEAYACLSKFKLWASEQHGAVTTAFQALTGSTGGKLTETELAAVGNIDASLLIQGLNLSNNVIVQHTVDEKNKKISWEVPFLIEKDVRFLDKWDIEWEQQESGAKDLFSR